jgi:hypothetical protein
MKNKINIEIMSPDELVSWFLISSYSYYKLGKPIMTDSMFDDLVERLKIVYGKSNHPHKNLITKEHLAATTGYDIEYPTIVKQCALDILRG